MRTLHHRTCDDLQVSFETRQEINELLGGLEKLLSGVSFLGELSLRSKDLLVSYGERMSVRLVAAQLNLQGVPAKAFDAWDLGLKTTSEFGNAEVMGACYGAIAGRVEDVLAQGLCAPGYGMSRWLGQRRRSVCSSVVARQRPSRARALLPPWRR